MTEAAKVTNAASTLADHNAAYSWGALDPVDLTNASLRRAEAENDRSHAFITLMRDSALESAVASAKRYAAGAPLSAVDGIPIAIKDFFDTAGTVTTAGFRHFAQRVPKTDAAIVRRAREVGAIILGKSNMDALGRGTTGLASDFGAIRNPRWPGHVPGGSSAGSGAAISAGLVFASIDTDAAGSARLPAACCGIAGFKPTYGLLSGDGILADQPADETILAFAHVALQARSAADIAQLLSALTGHALSAPAPPMKVARVSTAVWHESMQPAMDAAITALGKLAAGAGCAATPLGLAIFDIANVKLHRDRANELLFQDCDVLALPTLAEPVPAIGVPENKEEMGVRADNVFFANYFGLPAVTIPVGIDHDGLPVSLQLVGRAGQDMAVLALAAALESSLSYQTGESCG